MRFNGSRRTSARERARLDAWCAGVGEAAIHAAPAATGARRDRHRGDHVRQLERARRQRRRPRVRQRSAQAATTPAAARSATTCCCCRRPCEPTACPRSPRRVGREPHRCRTRRDPDRHRRRSARELGLSLIYVPSMRNGNVDATTRAEDRGNAILSTLPLSEPLPSSCRANASGASSSSRRRRRSRSPSFISTRSAERTSGCGCSGRHGCATCRSDRRRGVLPDGPLVIGGDLNTWHGRDELAARFLGQLFRATPLSVDRQGLGLRVLDYMFFRAGTGPARALPPGRTPIRIGPSPAGGVG